MCAFMKTAPPRTTEGTSIHATASDKDPRGHHPVQHRLYRVSPSRWNEEVVPAGCGPERESSAADAPAVRARGTRNALVSPWSSTWRVTPWLLATPHFGPSR